MMTRTKNIHFTLPLVFIILALILQLFIANVPNMLWREWLIVAVEWVLSWHIPSKHFMVFCHSLALQTGHSCSFYEVLPKISENLLVITWILTLSPNFHHNLRSSHLGLVYNDPSDFAIFGSTHWSLLALACLVPVVILLGSMDMKHCHFNQGSF